MIHHWLKESRDLLRSSLTDSDIKTRDKNILVMPDGQPAPNTGELFIAVHSGGASTEGQLGGPTYKETYTLICTVTQRVRNSPEDRDGDKIFLGASAALSKTASKVARTLSNNTSLFQTVITAVTDEDESAGVLEPLFFNSISPPVARYMEWFYSNDPHDADRQPAGYSIDVVFTGGTVIYKLDC